MINLTLLSPAAQAVLDAYWKAPWDLEDRVAIAAALRVAGLQLREAFANEEPIQADDWLNKIADEMSEEYKVTIYDHQFRRALEQLDD